MNKRSIARIVLVSLLIGIYLVVGIITIVNASNKDFQTDVICGVLVIVTSLVHLLLYVLRKGYENPNDSFFVVIGIVGVAAGFVFVFSDALDIQSICFFWGVIDIVRGALEIKGTIPEIKYDKLNIVEIGISTGDIILGVLLCIHLEHGITLHLTYLGIAFILSAINAGLKYYLSKKRAKRNLDTQSK